MQPSNISLQFEDNGRFHDDLVLRLGDREWRCDSYYLLLDNAMLPDREDAAKVRDVLRRLLDQWCLAVTKARDGETSYLPYDFSDEYTGWLQCRKDGSQLRVQPGWADVNGYAVLPSDVGELLRHVPSFRPDGDEVTMEREAFLRSICGRPAAA
jgi:hypothetical protein